MDFVKAMNDRHALRALFVRERPQNWDVLFLFLKGFRSVIDRLFIHSNAEEPQRVITAWVEGRENIKIAKVRISDVSLFIQNCAGKSLQIPWEKLPMLNDAPGEARSNFEIDSDASNIYWPDLDVHLDFESCQYLMDSSLRDLHNLESLKSNLHFGQAIRAIREKCGLRQSSIDGVSDRQVRRIEKGQQIAHSKILSKFAEAHNMPLNEYLNILSEQIRSKKKSN